MAKNYIQPGDIVRATAPYTLTSGSGAKIGSGMFGVALTDIASGALGEFGVEGVFDIAKAAGAWTEGALVYWDNTNKVATLTQAGNMRIGRAVLGAGDAMALSGDATGRVLLDESAPLRVAYGQQTTVAAADTIGTGLSTVIAVVACLDSDPTDNPEWVTATIGDQAGAPAAGSIIIKTWQNTGGTDPTPAAATTFSKKVNWMAIGT
jgi:predicted RecA/RadA family phage recombinase